LSSTKVYSNKGWEMDNPINDKTDFAEEKAKFDRMHGNRPLVMALRSAVQSVEQRPWTAMGVAAVAGLVIGLSAGRRRTKKT
jgi:hypothetical protein